VYGFWIVLEFDCVSAVWWSCVLSFRVVCCLHSVPLFVWLSCTVNGGLKGISLFLGKPSQMFSIGVACYFLILQLTCYSYHRQGGYVIASIYLFVCLLVCSSAGLQKSCRRIWLKFSGKLRLRPTLEVVVNFWSWSRAAFGCWAGFSDLALLDKAKVVNRIGQKRHRRISRNFDGRPSLKIIRFWWQTVLSPAEYKKWL